MDNKTTENISSVSSVLKITHFVFDELSFKRKGFKQKSEEEEVPIEVGTHIGKVSNGQYNVTLQVKVDKDNEYVALVRITGYCEIDENYPDKDILLKENAVAILFPFVRAQMTLLTAQPETDPLVLPPINIKALVNRPEDYDGNEQAKT